MNDAIKAALLADSTARTKLNELQMADSPNTDAITLAGIEYREASEGLRTALIAEDGEETVAIVDGESRERLELRERSSLAAFVSAAVRGAEVKGAEAEVSAAHGCPHGFVPWEMLEVREAPLEYRDVTPAPSTTGIQQAAIQPSVFLANALSFLGIDMPVVDSGTPAYPVLSTKVTAEARDKGVAGPATAGAYTVTTTTFKRITGAFDFSMEDAQKLVGLEESLRENIGSVMGSAIDEFGLNGQAAVSNKVTKVHGLMGPSGNNNQEIVPATAEGTTTNFVKYIQKLAGAIDGLWATSPAAVRLLTGPEVVAHMLSQYSTTGPRSAYNEVSTVFGGVYGSDRVPHATNVQAGLARLTSVGQRAAVMPRWQGVELIRDPYSNSLKGEVRVTAAALIGGIKVLRQGAFKALSFKAA